MRSIKGNVVYLDAISDPVFAEMEELIHEICNQKARNESLEADLIHSLFGLTYDLDPDDNEYSKQPSKNIYNNSRYALN